MGVIRQRLAELLSTDSGENRIEPEAAFALIIRNIARQEADKPVQVVTELPAEAPAGSLFRLTTGSDLYLGNGPGRALSRFLPVAL